MPINRINKFKYCSRKCGGIAILAREKSNCEICSTEFELISSRLNKAKYCSRKCYYKSQRKKGTVKFNCEHCNKEFLGSPSQVGKRKYCSKNCTTKEKHKNFNPNFTTVRKSMLRRNLINICNRCEYSEFPVILGVHHKDRNRNNNNISNLEVLCPNCHSLEHRKHISHGFDE